MIRLVRIFVSGLNCTEGGQNRFRVRRRLVSVTSRGTEPQNQGLQFRSVD